MKKSIFSRELLQEGSESFETLFENPHAKIELIHSHLFLNGEWYDQERDEWVVLLRGEATLEFDAYQESLACGNYIFIPKHQRHRVVSTSKDALWLCVHF